MPVWDKASFDRFYRVEAEPWGRPAGRPPVVLHYHDWWIGKGQREVYSLKLATLLGMVPGDSVVLVGCGFNWTGQGLATQGIDVVGIDTSDYILAEKDNTEEAEIRAAIQAAGLDPDSYTVPTNIYTEARNVAGKNLLDIYLTGGRSSPAKRAWGTVAAEDMATAPSRNSVRSLLNNSPRYVITEETLNSVDDATVLLICEVAQKFMNQKGAAGGKVVHVLSPLQLLAVQEPELNWKTYAGWRAFLDANGFQDQGLIASVSTEERIAYAEVF